MLISRICKNFLQHQLNNFKSIAMSYTTGDIVEKLQNFATLSLAENWDNVGLLVDPISDKQISTILLTNDLTPAVVDEAIDAKANFIITYHPNIFRPLKSVTSRTWKERIIVQCLRNEIAVFSPHTSWDSVQGGVNDWLASIFQYSSIKPLQPSIDNPQQGPGRYVILKQPEILQTIIGNIKQHIDVPHLRLALARNRKIDSLITTVAICAGSGASLLNGIEADLYLTGEMLHHDVLEAVENGRHVVLCNHSDSERGFLHVFRDKLQNEILNGTVDVVVSKIDSDPLKTV